jgi:cytoskeletal protein RodZ
MDQEKMESLGVWLSNARQEKGVSLLQAAQATCIRFRYLEMLEAGNTAGLPDGPVQARGFLSIYARYLGLSVDEALAHYDVEVNGGPFGLVTDMPKEAAPSPQAPAPLSFTQDAIPQTSHAVSFLSPLRRSRDSVSQLLLISTLVLSLAGVVTAAYFFIRGASGKAAVQAIASAPLATQVPSVSTELPIQPTDTTPADAAPTAIPEEVAVSEDGAVTVELEASEHVWVRIVQDGQKVFEDFMAQGQMDSWSGEESVVVETGNGAGLLVTVNGHSQGTMCSRGEICRRTWTPGGEVVAE